MVWIFCSKRCETTVTSIGGFAAPHIVCAGDLLFDEQFISLDKHKWHRSVAFSGGDVSRIKLNYPTFLGGRQEKLE